MKLRVNVLNLFLARVRLFGRCWVAVWATDRRGVGFRLDHTGQQGFVAGFPVATHDFYSAVIDAPER